MSSSNLEKHRSMYSSLVYRSWNTERAENDLLVRFQIELQPSSQTIEPITFYPELTFHTMADAFFALPVSEQTNIAFNLGLAELPSYWKAACPQNITIDAAHEYSESQIHGLLQWWHSLFIFGMSEFYFVNDIAEFGTDGFINWKMKVSDSNQTYLDYKGENLQNLSEYMKKLTESNHRNDSALEENKPTTALVPVGGGKDSAVTLSFFEAQLRDQNIANSETSNKKISDVQILLLNPTAAAERIAKMSGFESMRVSRKIDPKLIELNQKGFLNGHTPFSSYLAFVSFAAAHMQGISEIVLSNEQSADEGNTWFHGLDINHQYSKTTQFEKSFQSCARDFLPGNTYYYSILRPLYEIQIGTIFSKTQYNQAFLSCNVGGKKDKWCGNCPKCLFAYTLLYPHFLQQSLDEIKQENLNSTSYQTVLQKMAEKSPLFALDLFSSESQISIMQDLLGVGPHKPLECVGLYQETLLSAWKSLQLLKEFFEQNPQESELDQLAVLKWFKSEILPRYDESQLEIEWQQMRSHWNQDHTLPRWLKPHFYNWVQENMQNNLDDIRQKKQKTLLLGLGSEALSSFKHLQETQNDTVNAEIWIADETPLEKINPVWQEALNSKKIAGFVQLAKQREDSADQTYLENLKFDVVIKSPGIPLHKLTEIYQITATEITSNTQLFFNEVQKIKNSQPEKNITTIGVTGTKGKSTTAAVLHAALEKAGPQDAVVLLGGNIGTPPLELLVQIHQNLADNAPRILVVLELSCHQLAELTTSPDIAVVQKITPEHQDYYRSMEEYVESKTSICKFQQPGDSVFYFDDGAHASYVGQQGAGEKIPFTLENLTSLEERVGEVLVRDAFDDQHPDVRLKMVGSHNLINVLPALLVSEKLGYEVVRAADAARTFPGLPYRLQFIGSATIQTSKESQEPITLNFYNDSLATTPESSAAAITSFPPNSVHLIAGGHERNLSFQPLAEAIHKHQVKTIFLFPPTGTRIEQSIRELQTSNQELPVFIHVNTMSDVFSALSNSALNLQENDTVLLSPAAPSFGIFKDYRDRGDQFTDHLRKLQ